MLQFIANRVVAALVQLLVAATATFFLLQLIPGDPVWVMLGDEASEAKVSALREQLGLDKPIPVQYWKWLSGAARLDLGESLVTGRPVRQEIASRLPRTMELSLAGLIGAVILGIPIGVLAAMKRGTILDVLLNILAVIGFSVPVFVVGFILVLIFSMRLGWLPALGYVSFGADPLGHLQRMFMPSVAVGLGIGAVTIRMTRATTLEVLNQDFVRTARAKGLAALRVIVFHVVRNSLIPLVTVLGYYFGQTFGGSILSERIFNWPGISFLLIDSIQRRDYPTIQGAMLVIVALFLLINLIVDLAYGVIDPRTRYE